VELELKGKRPRIIRMEQAGVPTYDELVLVANADALDRDGDKIRAFIGALSRGVRDLRADPEKGTEGLLEANPDLDPELQRAAVKVTLPLFVAQKGEPFGWQDPQEWDAFGAWMQEKNLLKQPADVSESFDNGLLPGSGL
jgi:putative hydroxymethylpyrimidine transport system substrate-binding protein